MRILCKLLFDCIACIIKFLTGEIYVCIVSCAKVCVFICVWVKRGARSLFSKVSVKGRDARLLSFRGKYFVINCFVIKRGELFAHLAQACTLFKAVGLFSAFSWERDVVTSLCLWTGYCVWIILCDFVVSRRWL
jgi:hypothetical protein